MNRVDTARVGRAAFVAVVMCALSSPNAARAELSITKTDRWELYTDGRVNAFFSYGFGDALPVAKPGENIPLGAGLNPGFDVSPKTAPDGTPLQGTFSSMRLRSGFAPNIIGFGLRHKVSDTTSLRIYLALWATIESESQRRTTPVTADAREGYLQIDGPWGTLIAGRSLDLFSRGAVQNDFLYGHGYSLGFAGNIDNYGPTNGLIGFGVIAAFFSPGIVYATPTVGGLQLTAGVYDPTGLPGGYEATRSARPESELTYDAASGDFKLHLFANGEYQRVYRQSSDDSVDSYGGGYGGRVELGPVHVGVAGHYGKGLGLHYALESNSVSVSPKYELRTFDGYSFIAQYAAGTFDINAGWGISRVFLLDSDRADPTMSVPKNESAYFAALVFHATENIHFDLDYLHADAKWRFGEKQAVTFVNTGVTATW
jgi:hypothetical protein